MQIVRLRPHAKHAPTASGSPVPMAHIPLEIVQKQGRLSGDEFGIEEEIKDRYLDRQGGYVRVVKKGNRKGDGAPVSIIQLVAEEEGKKKGKKKGVAAKSGKTRSKQKAAEPAEKKETIEPKAEEKGETPEDQTDEEAK